MTDKAQKILESLKKRKPYQVPNPRTRDKILNDFNQSTLDPAGPLGGDQSMAVLQDMNELESSHDEFVKSLAP